MSRKILAFYSPYPGAGKTEAAKYLEQHKSFIPFSFAEPLRNILLRLAIDAKLGDVYKPRNKEMPIEKLNGASARDILIAFGAAGRSVYPNIWVNCLLETMRDYDKSTREIHGFLIDDLRFPNEYAMLRDEGAKIVRTTNPNREIVPSETEALLEGREFDAEIVNDVAQGLEQYHAQLDALIVTLFGGSSS